jgi:hypothetical protein
VFNLSGFRQQVSVNGLPLQLSPEEVTLASSKGNADGNSFTVHVFSLLVAWQDLTTSHKLTVKLSLWIAFYQVG